MVPASGRPDDQRVRCLYCGANNFAGSVSCWQCARPLVALREPGGTPEHAAPAPSVNPQAPRTPASNARPIGFAANSPAAMNAAASAGRAAKAAAWMGLLFPWFGLPVGIVFLMLDDDRKAQIGWITIGWSLAGLAINVIAGILLTGLIVGGLHSLVPAGGLGHGPGGSTTPSLPDLGDGIILVTARSLFSHFVAVPL